MFNQRAFFIQWLVKCDVTQPNTLWLSMKNVSNVTIERLLQ